MPPEIRIECVNREGWRALTKRFLDYNYLQNWEYGISCAERFHAISEHAVLKSPDDVIGIADVRVKLIPAVACGIAYISAGPLTRCGKTDDLNRFKICIEALCDEYVRRRGLVLRILAPVGPAAWNLEACQILKSAGMKLTMFSRGYRTILLDLSPSLEEIRHNFHKRWKQSLALVERSGLTLESGYGEELFAQFCSLYQEMAKVKKFHTESSPQFFANLQRELPEGEKFRVSLVYSDNVPAAGMVTSILADTCVYLLGASNEKGKKTGGSLLLQWDNITYAKSRGVRWYDLGGASPKTNPGTYLFKAGSAGAEVSAAGPFQMLPAGLKGYLVLAAEKAYRMLRIFRNN